MNLQELKTLALSKGINEDLDTIYKDAFAAMEAKGLNAEQSEKYALNKTQSLLKRQLASNAVGFEAVFYGNDKINDWSRKTYDQLTAAWGKAETPDQKQALIKAGLLNDKGQPLNQKYEKGSLLKPLIKRVCSGVLKTGEQMKLTLYNERVSNMPPLNVPVQFRAIASTFESKDGFVHLSGTSVTSFKVCGAEVPLNELVEKTLYTDKVPSNCLTLERVNKMVVLDDFTVIDVKPASTPDKSSLMKISPNDCDMEKPVVITCWMPPTMELPPVDTVGAILIGRVGKSKRDDNTEEINIQVMGFWIPPMFRMENKPEPITEAAEPEVWTE